MIGSSGKGELTVQLEHVLSARKNFQKMNMRNKQNMEALWIISIYMKIPVQRHMESNMDLIVVVESVKSKMSSLEFLINAASQT